MKDMGFTFDPNTAGSSVRFDPPDPKDRAISFHKPHPDPSIDRVTLKLWSKKLQKYYGWRPEDVIAAEPITAARLGDHAASNSSPSWKADENLDEVSEGSETPVDFPSKEESAVEEVVDPAGAMKC
ncbi:hypothetical protein C8J56DRAFT_925684 [Mycena floridula]|nr:hypothetical protein C8J56DRAFT_925684 [Mycena floridula]